MPSESSAVDHLAHGIPARGFHFVTSATDEDQKLSCGILPNCHLCNYCAIVVTFACDTPKLPQRHRTWATTRHSPTCNIIVLNYLRSHEDSYTFAFWMFQLFQRNCDFGWALAVLCVQRGAHPSNFQMIHAKNCWTCPQETDVKVFWSKEIFIKQTWWRHIFLYFSTS